jgi:hypothetical protein
LAGGLVYTTPWIGWGLSAIDSILAWTVLVIVHPEIQQSLDGDKNVLTIVTILLYILRPGLIHETLSAMMVFVLIVGVLGAASKTLGIDPDLLGSLPSWLALGFATWLLKEVDWVEPLDERRRTLQPFVRARLFLEVLRGGRQALGFNV